MRSCPPGGWARSAARRTRRRLARGVPGTRWPAASAPTTRRAHVRRRSRRPPAELLGVQLVEVVPGGELGPDHRPGRGADHGVRAGQVDIAPSRSRALEQPEHPGDAGDAAAHRGRARCGRGVLARDACPQPYPADLRAPTASATPRVSLAVARRQHRDEGATMAMTTTTRPGASVPRPVGTPLRRWSARSSRSVVAIIAARAGRRQRLILRGPRPTRLVETRHRARGSPLSFLAGWFAVVLLGRVLSSPPYRRSRPTPGLTPRAARPGGAVASAVSVDAARSCSYAFAIPAAATADQGRTRPSVEFFDLAGAGLTTSMTRRRSRRSPCVGTDVRDGRAAGYFNRWLNRPRASSPGSRSSAPSCRSRPRSPASSTSSTSSRWSSGSG